ncbi:hypothetical protein [Oricola cellulosilytica]|uniref:Uncharacterized protein n=1 Tax=Oricola cellulosilytica TaxID=1429082 RepID=A0A4R0PB18_9HYPH|nr:hypothetical protein [Oricola cellulosilytica]TCD13168.1 hypothetical protein E0D97_14280 [Oricola cellulosilytica]
MKLGEKLAFVVASILFAIFLTNVILGAARFGVVLSDVGEMLALFGACIFFVIAVLGLERRQRESGRTISNQGGDT